MFLWHHAHSWEPCGPSVNSIYPYGIRVGSKEIFMGMLAGTLFFLLIKPRYNLILVAGSQSNVITSFQGIPYVTNKLCALLWKMFLGIWRFGRCLMCEERWRCIYQSLCLCLNCFTDWFFFQFLYWLLLSFLWWIYSVKHRRTSFTRNLQFWYEITLYAGMSLIRAVLRYEFWYIKQSGMWILSLFWMW